MPPSARALNKDSIRFRAILAYPFAIEPRGRQFRRFHSKLHHAWALCMGRFVVENRERLLDPQRGKMASLLAFSTMFFSVFLFLCTTLNWLDVVSFMLKTLNTAS